MIIQKLPDQLDSTRSSAVYLHDISLSGLYYITAATYIQCPDKASASAFKVNSSSQVKSQTKYPFAGFTDKKPESKAVFLLMFRFLFSICRIKGNGLFLRRLRKAAGKASRS